MENVRNNTFVGFVFQEYNILNEFSVEDNIALALELQGKPKDKNIIKRSQAHFLWRCA
jgi:ABC-type lipoprotein export system ATPase subunit